MTNEFEIDKSTGKVYEKIMVSSYYKTCFIKQEIDIDTNLLTTCQCLACPCKNIVLKTELICEYCWKNHDQHDHFKTVVLPKDYIIDYRFIE